MGAIAIVEMGETMDKEEEEDRQRKIAAEARGSWATDQTAGPSVPRANIAPRANNNSTGSFTGTIPKYNNRVWVAKKEEREKHRAACGYRGGSSTRARSHSKHGGHNKTRGGHSHHQPSAGYRDEHGDRVLHPRQDHGPRAGAGQSARQAGRNSAVDSHGRNFGAESTDGWEWDEEEGGQQE